jgi:hypothetical protein
MPDVVIAIGFALYGLVGWAFFIQLRRRDRERWGDAVFEWEYTAGAPVCVAFWPLFWPFLFFGR